MSLDASRDRSSESIIRWKSGRTKGRAFCTPLRRWNCAEALGRVKASLAALAAIAALTRTPRFDERHLSERRDFQIERRTPA
jgi:hypothetical protein